MSYTRLGPFVDGGAPYLNAAAFNHFEDELAAVDPANIANRITGWFHVDQYGAVGNGTTDDRAAIQAAITAANVAYTATGALQRVYIPPKTYGVGVVNYVNASNGAINGAVSLMLYDGVEIFGPGTIKVLAGGYGSGALYAAIRSPDTGLSNASIRDVTIDGNVANHVASVQCSNIVLEAKDNVEVSGTKHPSANGNAIMVRGTTTTPATNLRINRNHVGGATAIGIQAAQFNGLEIDGNIVGFTTNNGIDIYGENGSATSSGTNWRISNNRVHHAYAGIFPETVAYGIVEGNVIWSCTESGIHCNRINGAPTNVFLTGNLITNCPTGIYITGDMGSIYIRNNTVGGATTACIQLGGGGSTSSHVYIADNFLDTATVNSTALVLVAPGTNVWAASTIRRTLTQNTNRSYDVVNYATTTTGVSYDAANT